MYQRKASVVSSKQSLLSEEGQSLVNFASQGDAFCAQINRQPSSYPEYLEHRETEWVHLDEVLGFFSKTNPFLSYQSFVEQQEDLGLIQNVAIDL